MSRSNKLLTGAVGLLGALARNPAWLVAASGLVLAGFQYEQARHWRKTDARDAAACQQAEALLLNVKTEVDRGVGQRTEAAQAAFYIHRFVDNLIILKDALGRQSAALRAAERDADARRAAAAEASKPTMVQRAREGVRRQIVDPNRTTGLTPDEWGRL